MKKHLLAFSILAGLSLSTQAQVVLLADTSMATGTSSAGNAISAIGTGGTSFGLNINESLFFRLAEDFTVPAGETWKIDSLITFGYQTGSTAATSTFNAGYVRVYNGIPGAGGTLIGGDTTTNRLVNSGFSGIYRVNNNTSTDVTRPIMRLRMSVPATTPAMLPAGTYWISWSAKGSLASGPFSPGKVLPTGTYPSSQNGRQNDTGVWNNAIDGTAILGFNMILKGTRTTTSVGSEAAKLAFKLNAPYPNPIPQGNNASLSFSVGMKSHVNLRVLNAVGQQVATIMEQEMTAGEYIVPFSTANLAAGSYRVVLQTESGTEAVPMTVK